jgi:hypothetical protein
VLTVTFSAGSTTDGFSIMPSPPREVLAGRTALMKPSSPASPPDDAQTRGGIGEEPDHVVGVIPDRGRHVEPIPRDPSLVALARQTYDGRDFSRMPILADALPGAGCDNPDVLDHCLGEGPHVRGCRVVDPLLGRK